MGQFTSISTSSDTTSMMFFTIVLIAFAATGFLFGVIRGTKKALIRFIVVLASALLAISFSAQLADEALLTPLSELSVEGTYGDGYTISPDMTLQDVIVGELQAIPEIADLMETVPTLTDFILMAPRAIIGLILFVVLFFVIKFVLGIVEWIIKLIFVRGSKGRFVGAIIGALQGAFCALVVLVPVFGFMTLADTAVDAAASLKTEDTPQDSAIVAILDFDEQFYTPFKQDPVYGILKSVGVDAMCTDVFYTVSTGHTAEGKEVNFFRTLNETIPALIQIADLGSLEFEELTPENMEKLRQLAENFATTPLIADSVSELLSGASASLLAGEEFMGITYPDGLDEKTDAFLTDVLTALATTEKEALSADLPEIMDVIFVLADSGLLDAMSSPDAGDTVNELLSDEQFLNTLLNEMAESAVLGEITVSAINNFGMTALAESLSIPKNSEEAYSVMIDEVNAELSKYSNLNMSEVVLLSTTKTESELATESVAKILMRYAKNLAEEHARVAAYGLLAAHCTEGATPATVEDVAVGLALSAVTALQADSYEPACVTLEDIVISDPQIFAKMTEEERKEEIANLTKIVTTALTLVEELENGGDLTENLDILPAVGELMNTMTESALLGDASQNVMIHFVSSDAVADILDETAVEVLKEKISEGAVDYESTLTSITASYKLVEFLNSPPDLEDADAEQLSDIVELLFTSIDETTVEILQKTVNSDFLAKMGVPEEAVTVSTIVVQTLFAEIGNAIASEEGAIDYAAEGEAIQSLIGLLMNGETEDGEEVSEEFLTDAIIDTLLASDTITNTLISVCKNPEIMEDMAEWLDEDDRAAAAEVIAEYEANLEADNERARECIAAIRILLGITE